ncbi:hypothetical protein [Streptomyces prunicolor]
MRGIPSASATGTKLGDPIEVEALTDTFRSYTDREQKPSWSV